MKQSTKKNYVVATIHEAIKWIEKYEDISGHEVEVVENGEKFRADCIALTEDDKLDLLEAATLIIVSLKELHKIALQNKLESLKMAQKFANEAVRAREENLDNLKWAKTIPSQVRKNLATFAANAKYGGHGGIREKNEERKKRISAIWANGQYSNRDDCAYEEYKTVGYGSFKTARKALTNTPDPSPWPAKTGSKK